MTLAEQRVHRGRLIAFEGDEGSGKTTQMEILATEIRRVGHEVLIVQEPGTSVFGQRLRAALKDKDTGEEIDPFAEYLTFLAQRVQQTKTIVLPALLRGAYVLKDRSYGSSQVYQGWARGLDVPGHQSYLKEFQLLQNLVADLAPIDLGFILDVPLEVSVQRIRQRAEQGGEALDRFELAGDEFRRAVNNGYRRLATWPGYEIVDGVGTKAEVAERVRRLYDDWRHTLGSRGPIRNPGTPFYGTASTPTTRED